MINTVDVIAELLKEISSDLDAQGVVQVQEGHWTVVYDEQTIVELCYQAERHCLELSLELGSPPEERQADTYRYLMAYSALTDQTGGIRIVLDAPDGALVQLFDLFTEDLDRVTLQAVLTNFIETARAWRTVVEKGLEPVS